MRRWSSVFAILWVCFQWMMSMFMPLPLPKEVFLLSKIVISWWEKSTTKHINIINITAQHNNANRLLWLNLFYCVHFISVLITNMFKALKWELCTHEHRVKLHLLLPCNRLLSRLQISHLAQSVIKQNRIKDSVTHLPLDMFAPY